MGAVNDIITAARYKISDTLGKNFKDAELISYLNEGNRMMRKAVALLNPDLIITKETKNTVIGTDNITTTNPILLIPDAHLRVDKTIMTSINMGEINEDLTTRGKPAYYWREGFTTICLYPVPDKVYACDVRYVAQSTALAAGGSTIWPSDFDDIIQEYMVIRAGTRDGAIIDVESKFLQWFIDQTTPLILLNTPAPSVKPYW